MSSAAGLTVEVGGSELVSARDAALDGAVGAGMAGRLAGKDDSLWGPDARHEASIRLGWLDLPTSSRELLEPLAALRAELATEGLPRVVLAGMGGSSLAPEVITRTAGVDLVVLDTTDAGQVRAALIDLEHTVVVVSSKSGGTVETLSHQKTFAKAFADAGLPAEQVGRRFVAVTDPGSGLAELARTQGFRATFLADPNVGGRYSALSAFGIVPSALAGADVAALLDEAAALSPSLANAAGNPALELGATLGGAGNAGHDKVVLVPGESGPRGFGDWAEQLIAESTGKNGTGLLPVVVEGPSAPGTDAQVDTLLVYLGGTAGHGATGHGATGHAVADSTAADGTDVSGPLGAQFLAWEYAVAVAGEILSINPFDQPNVTESKENTNAILAAGLLVEEPAFTDGAVQVFADTSLLAGVTELPGALSALLAELPDRGYLAVMAYLDRHADAAAADLRRALAGRTKRPVTFGWGPRFLHSTGQYHKGGPADGGFLQLTGAVAQDLAVPGEPYGFQTLQAAQAAGDRKALVDRRRPLLHLHLTDRAAGIAQLLEAVG